VGRCCQNALKTKAAPQGAALFFSMSHVLFGSHKALAAIKHEVKAKLKAL
jgi:hypothetical protein